MTIIRKSQVEWVGGQVDWAKDRNWRECSKEYRVFLLQKETKYMWGLQDNTDTSGGEAGDQGSLSSWNNNIGICIHFQKESGFVTF